MSAVWQIYRRELGGYLVTPLMAVFLLLFLVLAGVMTFVVGGFYERGQADLQPFFESVPWLFLLLGPALGMRMWAEERRSGSLELLFSLPLRSSQVVAGKFLAAWTCAALALVLTMPIWLIVNYLGRPDNGVIAVGYLGSLVLAGLYLAIGSAASALTRSQPMAFTVAAAICLALLLAGYPPLHDAIAVAFGAAVADAAAELGVGDRFAAIARGVLVARDVVYFLSGMLAGLVASWLALELGRGD
ncbi:MAG TPA: ABC transporter permease [Rhodanobacteraceae bacterium]|nr:ABC transporter permease [Rhodanobacteraceae bacterium]